MCYTIIHNTVQHDPDLSPTNVLETLCVVNKNKKISNIVEYQFLCVFERNKRQAGNICQFKFSSSTDDK